MATDGTSGNSTENTMVARVVACDTADDGSLNTASRISGACHGHHRNRQSGNNVNYLHWDTQLPCSCEGAQNRRYGYQFPVALRTQSRTTLTNMRPFTLLKIADATSAEAAVNNVGFMIKSPISYMGSLPRIHNGWWDNKILLCA
jgi:hypothetical protein